MFVLDFVLSPTNFTNWLNLVVSCTRVKCNAFRRESSIENAGKVQECFALSWEFVLVHNYVDRYSSPSRTSEPTKFQYLVPSMYIPGILYLSRPRKSILFLARKLKDSNRQNDVQHVYFENGEVGTSCVSIPPLGSAVRIGRRWLPLWHNEQTGDGIYRETERFSRPRQPPKFSGGFVLQS